MKTSLPEWANEAINESCQGKSWQTLINSIQQHLKVKHSSSSVPAIQRKEKMTKRFSEYHELEQAVLVEQELRELQLQGDQSLVRYNEVLNSIIDDKLMGLIDLEGGNSKISKIQQLMTSCARIIIGALESSPPQLQSTAKLFINRPIPDDLRAFLWSSSLDLNRRSLQLLPVERISPSLDVILSRRCHLLLDSHFRDLSTRSSSALVKSILVDFIKRNYLSLPSDDIILPSTTSSATELTPQHNDYTIFDRLFFVAIVLCSVFPGPIASPSPTDPKLEAHEVRSNSIPISKPQYTLSVALQALMEERHLSMYSSQNVAARPSHNSAEDGEESVKISSNSFHQISTHSPFLAFARTLVTRKNSSLSDHILSLFSSSSLHSDILQNTSSPYVKSLPHVSAAQYTVITYFYDILINESLLRALSGLLPLSATQFVWDQCFIFGFHRFLPLVTSALILGCGSEILSLSYGVTVIETFVSYCQHQSVESLQRLLSEHCEAELQDLFDLPSAYVLDSDEDGDSKILQAVCRRLNPWDTPPPRSPDLASSSPQPAPSSPRRPLSSASPVAMKATEVVTADPTTENPSPASPSAPVAGTDSSTSDETSKSSPPLTVPIEEDQPKEESATASPAATSTVLRDSPPPRDQDASSSSQHSQPPQEERSETTREESQAAGDEKRQQQHEGGCDLVLKDDSLAGSNSHPS